MSEKVQFIIEARNKFSKTFSRFKKSMVSVTSAINPFKMGLIGLLAPLAGAAGIIMALKSTIQAGAKFEQSMKTVGGIMRATAGEFKMLSDVAKQMGATTEWSATQAADALKFLGMAGFAAQKATAALPGVLDLATAANVDLARAADIASNALTGMGLPVEQLGRVNDVFVSTMTKSNVSMEQMAESFKYSAPLAKAYGYEIEEAAALIGTLGNAGVQGSMAGTQLSFAFQKVGKVFQKLGMDGEGKNLIDALKEIKKAGWDNAQIMSVFGNRAGRAALILKDNIPVYEALTEANKNAHGAAKFLADMMRDTLSGAFKELKSVIESVQIDIFESEVGGLKDALQGLTLFIKLNKTTIIEWGTSFIKAMLKAAEFGAYAIVGLIDAWRGMRMIFEVLKISFAGLSLFLLDGINILTNHVISLNDKWKEFGDTVQIIAKAFSLMMGIDLNTIEEIFDRSIESTKKFETKTRDAIYAVLSVGDAAYATLNKLANEGLSVKKVSAFKDMLVLLKDAMDTDEMAEAEGIAPFTKENLDKAKANIKTLTAAQKTSFDELNALRKQYLLNDKERLQEWYDENKEKYAEDADKKILFEEIFYQKKKDLRDADDDKEKASAEETKKTEYYIMLKRLGAAQNFFGNMASLASTYGKGAFKAFRAMAIGEAIMSTWAAGARALKDYKYPWSLIAMAAAIASGMAQVRRIRAQTYQAHSGLTVVPRDDNYQLASGERVLSSEQNKDLTGFLDDKGAGEKMTINIPEINIQTAQPLDKVDWERMVEENIIPAFSKFAEFDIKPTGY